MYLNKKQFLNLIKIAPLCSIDILIEYKKKYLFGLRTNKPSINKYFVPGGRIFKNEMHKVAIKRILKEELNLKLKQIKFKFLGVYDHFYRDNVFNHKDINTHYFVCAIKIVINKEFLPKIDSQHKHFIFMTKKQALNCKKVHRYCKIYLKEL